MAQTDDESSNRAGNGPQKVVGGTVFARPDFCIVRTPNIASTMLLALAPTQTTCYKLLMQELFRCSWALCHERIHGIILLNANGEDRSAWMRYDLIDGATDLVMIDCKHDERQWKDFSAHSLQQHTS